jgi:hypothetical protein
MTEKDFQKTKVSVVSQTASRIKVIQDGKALF